MQCTKFWLPLFMLFALPQMAMAQPVSQAPVWIFGLGLILLFGLSAYVVVKIREDLKHQIQKPAK